MSYMTAIAWSLVAASFALGGGQVGQTFDDAPVVGNADLRPHVRTDVVAGVNRLVKTSRDAVVLREVETVTLAFELRELKSTTVVMRLPTIETRRLQAGSNNAMKARGENRKAIIACEPVVSALVDVARHLQPGRCVT